MAGQYTVRLIALCLMMTSMVIPPTDGSACVRISGAFHESYYDDMYYVIGDQVYVLDVDANLANIYPVSDLNFNHLVTGALGGYLEYYLYSGGIEQGYGDFGEKDDNSLFASYAAVHSLSKIDAAFEGHGGEAYFFNGCDYVTVHEDTKWMASEKKPNSGIGLPCDLDAAIYDSHQGEPVAFKGNQAWIYDSSSGKFQGPVDIKDVLLGISYLDFCANA